MTQQGTAAFEARYLELLERLYAYTPIRLYAYTPIRLYAYEAECFQCPVGAGEITGGVFEGFG
jgi:hypothetical protein